MKSKNLIKRFDLISYAIETFRMCQIMNLLLLSPTIQEEIICSDDQRLFKLPENRIRDILHELDWNEQLKLWRSLIPQIPTP